MKKIFLIILIVLALTGLFFLHRYISRDAVEPVSITDPGDFSFSIPEEPDAPLFVDVSFPENDTSLKPGIIMEFNKPIMDQDDNIIIKEPFFELDPDIIAKRIAVSANHIEYELSKDIKPEKLYKLTLNNSLTIGSTEHILDQNTSFFLRTNSEPLVKDAYFTHINKNNRTFNLQIDFNFSISPRFIEEKIFIKTKDNIHIPYQIASFDYSSITLRITNPPFDLNNYRDPIYIHVSKGIQSKYYDDLNLRTDFIKPVNIPANTTLRFYNYEIQESGDKYNLILNFSDIIDQESIKSFISIKPNIMTDISVRNYAVVIEGNFTPNSAIHLNIAPGLISRHNNLLLNGISREVKFGNFRQMIGFEEKGTFMRKDGKKTLKFSYRNINTANIEVYKVFPNNIPVLFNFYKGWTGDLNTPDERVSIKLKDTKLELDFTPNTRHTHYINFKNLIDELDKGFYHIVLRSDEVWHARDDMWLCITDIGLITKLSPNNLNVWAVSLSTGDPVRNIDISLYSLNNQLLDTKRSDRDGKVIFSNLKEYTQETGIPFMVFAEKDKDFSFIDIHTQNIDLAEYKTHGADIVRDDYNAYFFSERNIYRPGDTVYFGGIVRKRDLNEFTIIKEVPVKMEITDSMNRPASTITNLLDDHGTVEYSWTTSDYQETGFYNANFLIGNRNIGSLSFQVEEFIPQRIQTLISSDKKSYMSNETISLTLKGLYLFGAPVSNGNYTVYGYMSPDSISIKGKGDHYFGITDLSDTRPVEIFRLSGNLDSQGIANIEINPAQYGITQYCRINIKAEITEQVSGRPVEDTISVNVNPFEIYPGINKDSISDIRYNQINTIKGILADIEGNTIKDKRELDISVYNLSHRYIYYYDNYYGRHRYRFETIENLIKSEIISSDDGNFSFDFNTSGYWGAYKIKVKDIETGSTTEAIQYPWWWGYGTQVDRNKAPHYIDIKLDAEDASPGDRVELVLNSPFSGNLLLTVNSDEVLLSEWHKVQKGHNAIRFRIPSEAKDYNNVYVFANIINNEYTHGSVPLRALGIANLQIDQRDHRLALNISHPESIKPNSTLKIEYDISNQRTDGRIAIFAVDEGILQIRRFITPNPYDFFFKKTALNIKLNDILGMIIPEFSELYTGRTGYGDFEEAELTRIEGDTGRVLRVEPLAFWSGFQDFDRSGKGSISFDIPNFLGKARIMAVAVSEDKFGSSESFVIIRDQIQVLTTLPRFLLIGDIFEIPITVINSTGREGEFTIDISSENIRLISFDDNKISLKDEESKTVFAKASPEGNLGHSSIKVSVTGNDEETFSKTVIPILPNSPVMTQYELIECPQGETDLNVYTKGWKPEFERTFISLSSLIYSSELEYLKYLIRYPYGCLEQNISSAFPLLYINDLEMIKGINEYLRDRDINQLILSAINNTLGMRIGDGGFGMWPSSNEADLWSTVYALHFLFEADQKGYSIDESVFNSLAQYINSRINIESNEIYHISTRAYAYYVLSLMKRTRENDIDFFLQRYRNSLLPESMAFIAGAYANLGNITKANDIINENLKTERGVRIPEGIDSRQLQRFFYSELRQKGIILNILMDMEQFADKTLKNQLLLRIVQDLRSRDRVYHYSTQELVWSLRALVKFMEGTEPDQEHEGYLYKDNERILTFKDRQRTVYGSGLTAHDLKVLNKTENPFYTILTIEGIKPGTGFTRYAQGIEIRRVFYDERGNLLYNEDLQNLKQGQDLYAKISIISQSRYDNIAIIDRVGAGFEIENPRITHQVLPAWIDQNNLFKPDHIDIKDHQIGFFGSINPGMQISIFYKVRALTKGSFMIPPVTVEAMYDPLTRASDSPLNANIN